MLRLTHRDSRKLDRVSRNVMSEQKDDERRPENDRKSRVRMHDQKQQTANEQQGQAVSQRDGRQWLASDWCHGGHAR